MTAEEKGAQNRTRILNAALIISVAFVVSRLLGLARDAVFNFYFGVDSLQADAYSIVSPTPELIFTVIAGGALGSAFIPTFVAYFAREDEEGAWRVFSAILNLVLLVMTLAAGLAALFAPQLLQALYGDILQARPEMLGVAVPLLRLMLISPIIFGASGVVMAALNARQHFLMPALAGIIYNLGIIAGTMLWAPSVLGVGIGTVVGSLGHLAIQLPALRQASARYRPIFTWRDPGVRQVLRLMAPRVLGLSFSYLNLFFTPLLAQGMMAGSLRALNVAFRLVMAPQGVLGQALGIASFPTFAALAAESDLSEIQRILSDTLRLIVFVGLPLTVLLAVLARPIIELAYQRGQFDAAATNLAAWGLLFYAPALVSLALLEVISRVFYALKDTLTPVLAGAVQIALMAGLSLWLGYRVFPTTGRPALGGVALAFTVSNWVETVGLLWLLSRRLHGLAAGRLWSGVWRLTVAAGGMAAGMVVAGRWLNSAESLTQLILLTSLGSLLYLLLCVALRLEEIHYLWRRWRPASA